MSVEGVIISFILGFFSGLLFFCHLFLDIRRSLREKKRQIHFWRRFLFLGVLSGICAYSFKGGFVSFPLGFYLSRLTFSALILRIGDRWILGKGS